MDKIKCLFQDSFAKSVILITGGTIFAQVINTILSPVITRIYTPDQFGVLTVFTAILGMINLLGALSYDSAIPIAEDDEDAINVLSLCFIILGILTVVLTFLLYFFGDNFLRVFDALIILEFRYLIPLGFFTTGLYTIFTKWAFRKKDFKSIAKTKYSQSITGNITKIGFGILTKSSVGLLLGVIIGQSAGTLTLSKPLIRNQEGLYNKVKIRKILWCAKRYIKFPLFSAPTLFLISFIGQIPVIFMSAIYNSEAVGYYGLAYTITFLPMTLVGKSVQDVFYGEISSIGRSDPDKVKELSQSLLKKLIIIGAIPMIILIFFGPELFSLVFGQNWYNAGIYSRMLTIFVFSHFIFHPVSTVFDLYEKQKISFGLNFIKLIIVLIIFTFAKMLIMDQFTTIFIFSIGNSIFELLKYIVAQKIINEEISRKVNR